MIFHLEKFARRVSRIASRNHWLVKVLGLSEPPANAATERRHGLIILQIDGLSRVELQRALESDQTPFLGKLLSNEHYHLHSLYSGIPSSTPAVQGELFYGVRGCVPAFSFKRHQDGEVVVMLEPLAAAAVEAQLQQEGGEPLLRGGSAYSNIFSGGARESSFCAASMGWSSVMPTNNPLKMAIFAVLNAYSFVRVALLMLIELLLAIIDFFRGLIDGKNLLQELKFVPTRVAACVLLRELVTIGVKLDAARGLPIIHANFIGYDEQAHRRGPRSRFAHWSLKGIDDSVARIWRTAQRSQYRNYDLWVYSDHGQEATIPSSVNFPQGIVKTVEAIFNEHLPVAEPEPAGEVNSSYSQAVAHDRILQAGQMDYATDSESNRIISGRANWLRRSGLDGWFSVDQKPMARATPCPEVVAMGPVGFIYSPTAINAGTQEAIAKALVDAGFPMVMAVTPAPTKDNCVIVWTAGGRFYLPADKHAVLGHDHQYLEDATDDLVRLVQHVDAGDFVICGWCAGRPPQSFRIENGAHAGPGPSETDAFALLPGDTKFVETGKGYLRMLNLREAAFTRLGRESRDPPPTLTATQSQQNAAKVTKSGVLTVMPNAKPADKLHCLRVLTYNIHSCIGMDGKVSTARIARVIAQYQPDVVALQELVVGSKKTNEIDQAHLIALELGMDIHFHPIRHVEAERFGNAILSDLPMRLVKAEQIASHYGFGKELRGRALTQPRGALWVELDFHGKSVNVITTHLGLTPRERQFQAEDLLSEKWLQHPCREAPVILCGDLNAAPSQQACRLLSTQLNDVQTQLAGHKPLKTFSGRYPTVRIDHVFVDHAIRVEAVTVPQDSLAKVASDHLPLVVDLEIP